MSAADLIGLTELPTALRRLTGAEPPPYRALYAKVVDGAVPAERTRGRWYVDRRNLAAIAKGFGLTVPAERGAAT